MAGIARTAKPISIEPLSGLFDHRSPADAVPFGIWRYLQNADTPTRNKLRRAPGWEKLLTKVGYNNQDLHDHLTDLSPGASRQPITMLYQATSMAGYSQLIAGTSKRLFALNNANGNWKVISDQLGVGLGFYCSDIGWQAAQVRNTVVLTNGYDAPIYHILNQPTIEPGNQSVAPIDDLTKIGLTLAKAITSFKGMIIFGNVVMDGERIAHRLIWSDVDRPLSWVPKSGTSAAGSIDLGYGEDILRMEKLADSLLVYTTAGIWELTLSGSDSVFGVRKRYSDHTAGNRCLAYRRTLVTTGSEHIYCGRDGIYRYSFYTPEPVREEWMHVASSVMYNDLAEGDCNSHCAGYNAKEKSVYISWAARGELCPNKTLVLNTQYESDYVLDHGFTAFLNYNPDLVKSLRDWIIEMEICTEAELEAKDFWYVKEGTHCTPANAIPAAANFTFSGGFLLIRNVDQDRWFKPMVVGDPGLEQLEYASEVINPSPTSSFVTGNNFQFQADGVLRIKHKTLGTYHRYDWYGDGLGFQLDSGTGDNPAGSVANSGTNYRFNGVAFLQFSDLDTGNYFTPVLVGPVATQQWTYR